MKKIFSKIFGLMLILFGIGIYAYPSVNTWLLNKQTEQYISEFQEKYSQRVNAADASEESESEESEKSEPEKSSKESKKYSEKSETSSEKTEVQEKDVMDSDPLYQEIKTYNENIFTSGQEGFRDAWSYQQSPVSLDGLDDGKFGYIQIPAMDLTLPLYIGASDSNMAKGAVVLGQTSIPVGEVNSNAVIAGHRGWSTGDFFLDIEELTAGDHIYITNPWQTLSYKVTSINIIDPYDVDAVKIQEGKDMVTLVTCHPYMSRGKYRYLVYAVRDKEDQIEKEPVSDERESIAESQETQPVDQETQPVENGVIVSSTGEKFESSSDEIRKEDMIRKGCAIAMILMVLISFSYAHIRDKKSNG